MKQSNWVDFENEISRVIQFIENNMDHATNRRLTLDDEIYGDAYDLDRFLEMILDQYDEIDRGQIDNIRYVRYENTYRQLRDRLQSDLESFTDGFEHYLRGYVEKIKIDKSESICRLLHLFSSNVEKHVLSFNYTTSIQRVLKAAGINADISYIHGEIGEGGKRLVLGIDEYLPAEDIKGHLGFAFFRKYNQRIIKAADSTYMDWLNSDKESEDREKVIYVFGHSLGVSDADILRSFFMLPDIKIVVFYHDDDHLNQCVANMSAIIGKDELIRRSGGNNRTIEFRSQSGTV